MVAKPLQKTAPRPVSKALEETQEGKTIKLKSEKETDHTVHRVLPQRKGAGLATKLTLFVVALMVLIVAVGQYSSYVMAFENASGEIDNQGVLLCQTLMGQGGAFLSSLETKVKVGGDAEKKIGSLLVEAATKNEAIKETLLAIAYLKLNDQGKLTVVYGEPMQMEVSGGKLEIGGVMRGEASINQKRVRRFSLNDTASGIILEVYLKAERLDELESTMSRNAMIIAVLSLVVGVMGMGVLAGRVAGPIKTLSHDMLRVARGELGYQSKVRGTDEVGVLANAFNMMSQDLAVAHKAEMEKREMDRDMAMAHDIQTSLIPAKLPSMPGWDLQAFYRSAKDVGGDYYDIVEVDADHTAFFVADVAGKGIQGAMIMAMTRGITRSIAQGCVNLSSAWILSQVNKNLSRDLKPGSFVTAMCVLLDKKSSTINVASAGHNPLVLIRQGRPACELVNPPGIALGFDKGPLFNRVIKDQTIPLRQGDRVVFYTDGVVEAMNPQRQEFGDKRFEAFCCAHSGETSAQLVEKLVQALDEHKGDGPQHDDITIVTLRKTA
ncbi:MAG: SpoIIE family protein phosphatase [Planctomycetota bacterium]